MTDLLAPIAAALAAKRAAEPAALEFLLRRYAESGGEGLRPRIEEGLTQALDAIAIEADPVRRSAWLEALLQARAMSDDERIAAAIDFTVPPLVEDLERLVRERYEPGDGLIAGDVDAHLDCASALLTLFSVTGRLPYAMLAEELLRHARRRWWDEARASFGGSVRSAAAGARVCARMAALHRDPEYVEAAVIASDADYARDAETAIAALARNQEAAVTAPFGLALLDLFALRSAESMDRASLIPALQNIATRLRIDSITSTSEAGSGHPTSCCSAADLIAALFFAEMRFDPKDPHHPGSDRFVLSKGHAAPILYAAWAEAGAFDRAELLKLREIGSDLEGHPTPRLPFVDVATGSLGQGICAAVGSALNARRINSDYRTYCMLGDGESAEGSVWEAADVAAIDGLENLCGITDVNGLGQSRATMWQHDMEQFARRWRAFGWHAIVIDGHDLSAILDAYAEARATKGQPTMILARTIKGKGVSFVEGKDGWHGKAFKKGEEMDRAIAELQKQFVAGAQDAELVKNIRKPASRPAEPPAPRPIAAPGYKAGDQVATREAYGTAIAKLAEADPRVVALDADVKNSTFSDRFEKVAPQRFYQNFIAEQVMVGSAMGLAARGAIPFPSTFACFLSRAADFVRMAAISGVNVKFAGSHAGVSIGEDGPSQMALEDLAMFRAQPNIAVLYPSDAVSTERLVAAMAARKGPAYMRTSRPKTPILYSDSETFEIGGLKVHGASDKDVATVVGAGVTLFEALKAQEQLKASGTAIRVIDLYSLQPIDRGALAAAGKATRGHIITVEDHYPAGGIGDAVAEAVADAGLTVHRIAVREIPHSGKPEELLDRYGISAKHIVEAVRALK